MGTTDDHGAASSALRAYTRDKKLREEGSMNEGLGIRWVITCSLKRGYCENIIMASRLETERV